MWVRAKSMPEAEADTLRDELHLLLDHIRNNNSRAWIRSRGVDLITSAGVSLIRRQDEEHSNREEFLGLMDNPVVRRELLDVSVGEIAVASVTPGFTPTVPKREPLLLVVVADDSYSNSPMTLSFGLGSGITPLVKTAGSMLPW
jgi:hypothetical protein